MAAGAEDAGTDLADRQLARGSAEVVLASRIDVVSEPNVAAVGLGVADGDAGVEEAPGRVEGAEALDVGVDRVIGVTGAGMEHAPGDSLHTGGAECFVQLFLGEFGVPGEAAAPNGVTVTLID